MVAVTNSQFLPYQTTDDRRCDAPAVWRQFVERVEERLTPIQLLANRLANVPMAFVEWFAPDMLAGVALGDLNAQWGFAGVNWTTVTVDTDNMVSLDTDPNHVTPRRPGVYQCWGLARMLQPFQIGSSYAISLDGGAGANTGLYLSRAYTSTSFWFNVEPSSQYDPTDMTASRMGYWNPDEVGANYEQGFRALLSGDNDSRVAYIGMACVWHSEIQV